MESATVFESVAVGLQANNDLVPYSVKPVLKNKRYPWYILLMEHYHQALIPSSGIEKNPGLFPVYRS